MRFGEKLSSRDQAWNELTVSLGALMMSGVGVEAAIDGKVLWGSIGAAALLASGIYMGRASIRELRQPGLHPNKNP